MDQHFLKNAKSYQNLLLSKGLGSQKIIEIGVGQGELTTLIHACNPTLIKGYEIDKSLRPATLDKLELIYQDILTADLSFLTSGDYYLISNPPYCLLPEIKERIIDRYPFKGIIMMVSEKYRPLFPDLEIALTFTPENFDPPTKPTNHYVLTSVGSSKNS